MLYIAAQPLSLPDPWRPPLLTTGNWSQFPPAGDHIKHLSCMRTSKVFTYECLSSTFELQMEDAREVINIAAIYKA